MSLSVLYQDEFMIAVCKPSGMIVHRGWDNDPVTAADIVRDQIVKAPVFAAHRLDRGTSGVLLFALDAETARILQKQNEAAEFKKRYLALVRGPMKEACILDHAIPKEKHHVRVPAITEFTPISHVDRWSLVEARPITGRLHQIRRHLKHLSHPVVGDVRYGKGDINRFFRETYDLNRLALHAFELSLKNRYDEKISIRAPLTDDLQRSFESMNLDYHAYFASR
jgi:tRNA pseudouridine65 synthase